MKKVRRKVRMSVLSGEPTDGSGRVCIHLFVRDDRGPITEPHVLHPVIGEDGLPVKNKLEARPTRGRLACDPKRRVDSTRRDGIIDVIMRTDDPRAATCPRCIASPDYDILIKSIGG